MDDAEVVRSQEQRNWANPAQGAHRYRAGIRNEMARKPAPGAVPGAGILAKELREGRGHFVSLSLRPFGAVLIEEP